MGTRSLFGEKLSMGFYVLHPSPVLLDLCIHIFRIRTVLERAIGQTCLTSGCWGCRILDSISSLAFSVSDHRVSREKSEVYPRFAPFVLIEALCFAQEIPVL
jgi:hypothetical protein